METLEERIFQGTGIMQEVRKLLEGYLFYLASLIRVFFKEDGFFDNYTAV